MTNSRICSVAGCDKAHYGRGWCKAHYRRWRKHGDPLAGGPLAGRSPNGEPLAFLEGTALSFEGDECLIWPYATNSAGYGRIRIDGKLRIVSRVVCEREHGPPPTPKHEAAHNCGKGHEGCCTRKHLHWATRVENEADKLTHGTVSRGERHGAAKLTEDQVLKIRASTKLHRELAAEYGIDQSAVSKIKLRKYWAWVENAS